MHTDSGSMEIIVTQPTLRYFINFADNNISLSRSPKFTLQTTITGPSKAFIVLLFTKQYNFAITAGLKITGNLELANQVQQILFKSGIDWYTKLETVFDPAIAYQIQQFGSVVKSNLIDFKTSLIFNITDYLLYEHKTLVSKDAMDTYLEEVDRLSLTIDRVEARINNLIAKQILCK